MGIINWLMHRRMKRHAEALVKWATESYEGVRAQHPELPERDVFRKMLDQRVRFPGGDKDRETVLEKYGSSLNGLCYYLGLNSQSMGGMMVSRCVQFTEYVDIELQKRGLNTPSDETKRRYFKTLGLPESAVGESYLCPSASLDPANLPRDVLVRALFENAILHAQVFVRRVAGGVPASVDTQLELASQISEYALAIMSFYFRAARKTDLQREVMEKHEHFLLDNCGTRDPVLRQQFLDAWHQEFRRKVTRLSVGDSITDLDKNTFAHNIMLDAGFRVGAMDKYQLRPYIEQFVSDVQASMKHFGICA